MSDLLSASEELARIDSVTPGGIEEPELENVTESALDVSDSEPVQETRQSEPEYSDLEKDAIAQGWNPQGVEGKPKKSAEEFIRDGEYIKQLKEIRDENKELKSGMNYVIEQFKKKEQLAYERALRDLESRRLTAVEERDVNGFQQAENEMRQLHQNYSETTAQADRQIMTAAVEDFKVRNRSWFNESKENMKLVAYAKEYENRIMRDYPDHSQRLAEVEKEVRREFPTHNSFRNLNRESPSPISTNVAKRNVSADPTYNQLAPAQQAAYKWMKRSYPNLTVKEYLADME
jgi:hypothetical protein